MVATACLDSGCNGILCRLILVHALSVTRSSRRLFSCMRPLHYRLPSVSGGYWLRYDVLMSDWSVGQGSSEPRHRLAVATGPHVMTCISRVDTHQCCCCCSDSRWCGIIDWSTVMGRTSWTTEEKRPRWIEFYVDPT